MELIAELLGEIPVQWLLALLLAVVGAAYLFIRYRNGRLVHRVLRQRYADRYANAPAW